MKIRWSPLALEQVYEIIDYIARDKPGAADRWADEVFDLVATLVQAPERGRVVPELRRPEIRELIHSNYRIVYRLGEAEIGILSVRNAARLLAPEDLGEV